MFKKFSASYCVLFFGLFLNSLSSVSIFSIPLPWIGVILSLFFFPRFFNTFNKYPYIFLAASAMILFSIIFNVYNWKEFYNIYPSNTTTNYFLYIFIRYLNTISFFAVVAVVYSACSIHGQDRIERLIINFGVLISIYAVYVYLAQTFGFPELLPRSRMGTGGGEQSVTYTYAFHRAVGSFREPSHLAEWLILPFALSCVASESFTIWKALLIGIAILLTGSLTGILSLIFAFFITLILFILLFFLEKNASKNIWSLVKLFFVVIFVGVSSIILIDIMLNGLLIETVVTRGSIIYLDGLGASNRDYVYDFFEGIDSIPWFGSGFGNIQIALAQHVGSSEIASILNLYANIMQSVGVLGFVAFLIFMLHPVWLILNIKFKGLELHPTFFLFVAYFSWMIAFYVHSEELSTMFALTFGLIIFRVGNIDYTPRSSSRVSSFKH